MRISCCYSLLTFFTNSVIPVIDIEISLSMLYRGRKEPGRDTCHRDRDISVNVVQGQEGAGEGDQAVRDEQSQVNHDKGRQSGE